MRCRNLFILIPLVYFSMAGQAVETVPPENCGGLLADDDVSKIIESVAPTSVGRHYDSHRERALAAAAQLGTIQEVPVDFFYPDRSLVYLRGVLTRLAHAPELIPRFSEGFWSYSFLWEPDFRSTRWRRYLLGATLLHDLYSLRPDENIPTIRDGMNLLGKLHQENKALPEFSAYDRPITILSSILHSKTLMPVHCLGAWRSLLIGGAEYHHWRVDPRYSKALVNRAAAETIRHLESQDRELVQRIAQLIRMATVMRPRGPHSTTREGLTNSAGFAFRISEDGNVYVDVPGAVPVFAPASQQQILYGQIALGSPIFEKSGERLQIHFPVFHGNQRSIDRVLSIVHRQDFFDNLGLKKWTDETLAALALEDVAASSMLRAIVDILGEFPLYLIDGATILLERA